MSRLVSDTAGALSSGGALARALDAFHPRSSQQELAAAIANAVEQGDVLLAEAGTGTGKTYAYLVPVLLSGKRTILSTGTRALQDQLFHRDLPRVQQALGVRRRTALLKGRANYLCRYRLEQALTSPQPPEVLSVLSRLAGWGTRTGDGDLSGFTALGEASPLLRQVTSTVDNCLGSDCPFWSDCFVVQARQRAQAADVVVVNHHLLLADLALKQEGVGEMLPGAEAFVIDEAHQLPELASGFFGVTLGAGALMDLVHDIAREAQSGAGLSAAVQGPLDALVDHVAGVRRALEGLPPRASQWRALGAPGVVDAFEALEAGLETLIQALVSPATASAGLATCLERARRHGQTLRTWLGQDAGPGLFDEVAAGSGDADALPLSVRWYETAGRSFRCHITPMDVSGPLRQHRQASMAAWIFTSATLTVDGGFDHIAGRLGLDDPATLSLPSPFDWRAQALCYLPRGLPDPAASGFTEAMLAAVRPVLETSGGRAFLLFSSHRALRLAAQALDGAPWPLFVQGTAPRARLLEQFRDSGNGVLLGAASFREGVDVVGQALTVVVIDKLPFAAPDDPVFEARLEAIERAGGNAFVDEQLPQAVIALKQGVGRLLRSETDRGVLVLCDRRLWQRRYGQVFFHSLPPFGRTRDLDDVRAFLGVPPQVEENSAGRAHTGDLFDELN